MGFTSTTLGSRPCFSSFSLPMHAMLHWLPPKLSSVLLNTVCSVTQIRLILLHGQSLWVCSAISINSSSFDGVVQQCIDCRALKKPRSLTLRSGEFAGWVISLIFSSNPISVNVSIHSWSREFTWAGAPSCCMMISANLLCSLWGNSFKMAGKTSPIIMLLCSSMSVVSGSNNRVPLGLLTLPRSARLWHPIGQNDANLPIPPSVVG